MANTKIEHKKRLTFVNRLKEAPTRFELVIEVLQTFALPLGYGAICCINKMHYIKESYIRQDVNDSDGNRTRVTAVKGRCLNRLTTEPYSIMKTEKEGFEPSRRSPDLYP